MADRNTNTELGAGLLEPQAQADEAEAELVPRSGGDDGGGAADSTVTQHQRVFIAAARELTTQGRELDKLATAADEAGAWAQRVQQIWTSVRALSAEVDRRRSELQVRHARQREVSTRPCNTMWHSST